MRKFLAVFDWDGTLADTPLKPEPNQDKRSWSGKDWWNSPASLLSPEKGGFYNGNMNSEVLEAFEKSRNDPDTNTIVLTGRRSPIAYMVRAILRSYGFIGKRVIDEACQISRQKYEQICKSGQDICYPDEQCGHEEYFTGDVIVTNGIQGTFGHKKEVLERKIRQNGGYERLDLWEDRKDHIGLLKEVGIKLIRENLLKEFVLHQVFTPNDGECYVIHIPVTKDSTW